MSSIANKLTRTSVKEIAMKTILFALVALSVISGGAGAFDAKTFYEQIDRDHN